MESDSEGDHDRGPPSPSCPTEQGVREDEDKRDSDHGDYNNGSFMAKDHAEEVPNKCTADTVVPVHPPALRGSDHRRSSRTRIMDDGDDKPESLPRRSNPRDVIPQKFESPRGVQRPPPFQASFVAPLHEPAAFIMSSENALSENTINVTPTKTNPENQSESSSGTAGLAKPGAVSVSAKRQSPHKQEPGQRSSGISIDKETTKSQGFRDRQVLSAAETVAASKITSSKSGDGSRGISLAAAEDEAEANQFASSYAAVDFASRNVDVSVGLHSSPPTKDEKLHRASWRKAQPNRISSEGLPKNLVVTQRPDGLDERTRNVVNTKASPHRRVDQLQLATASEDEGSHNIGSGLLIAPTESRLGTRSSFSTNQVNRSNSPVRNSSSQTDGSPLHQGSSSASNRPGEAPVPSPVAPQFHEAEVRASAISTSKKNNPRFLMMKPKKCIIATIFLATVVMVIIVALMVGRGTPQAGSTPLPSTDVTTSPSMGPTQLLELDPIKVEATESYILDQISSSDDLYTKGSPQHQAWMWLVSEDQAISFSSNMTHHWVQRLQARYILAVFYFALAGDKWKSSRDWLSDVVDECDWEFVTCETASGKVLHIKTTASIGGDPSVGSNNMSGGLPSELKHLDALERLQLPGNQLTELPLLIDTLRVLDLSRSSLQKGFENILSLTNLESLSMANTGWQGKWNEDMSNLSNLFFLDVSDNMLSGTLSLRGLTELQYVVMSNNRFESNLEEVLACDQCGDNLVSFVSVDNQLTGLLPPLTNFTTLETFIVSKSRVSGSIPTEYGLLTRLSNLDLSDNVFLSGVLPSELASLSKLEYLNIGGSSISGTIPSEFGQLQSVSELFFNAPFLTGTIPEALCAIESLEGIAYTGNLECSCLGEQVCILV